MWAQHSAPAPGAVLAATCAAVPGTPGRALTVPHTLLAALPCPALAGCPAAQRVAKPHCQVAYRDPMALDTNWCRLPRMNNIITGITVKRSHSHSLNAETGSRVLLGSICSLPSASHTPHRCPSGATGTHHPRPTGVAGVALCWWPSEPWGGQSPPGWWGPSGSPELCTAKEGRAGLQTQGPTSRSSIPSHVWL